MVFTNNSLISMTQPTLSNIFGAGTVRLTSGTAAPSSGIFIPDTALQSGTLDTPSTATAQQIFVAMLLNAKSFLTEALFNSDIDVNIYYSRGFTGSTNRGADNIQYRTDGINWTLAKVDTTEVDADDY